MFNGNSIVFVFFHFITALDPCTSGNYQTINSSDRLVGNTDQSSSKCDSHDLIPGWYRFAGDAGDGMPTYCPPTRRCGTDAPGWLSGSYPTMAEGVVNRKVCYHWSNRCCRWSNNIKIQNCGGYFVYQLAKPPFCHLRYCGNGHERKCFNSHWQYKWKRSLFRLRVIQPVRFFLPKII